ncbi:MAG TPA: carbohydrate kinase, partial [Firmicutes bacterium]|nr:carbohydrate kinase [Bacillota bacterium]
MLDVLTMGELLIDFVPLRSGVSLGEATVFKKAPGGAPANVAVGVRRLGLSSGFMGKIGDDEFGKSLVDLLAKNGVDVSGVVFEAKARTALAFVSLGPGGEREFMFYRHPSADMLLEPSEVNLELISAAQIFHHGSISLINEPVRSATMVAIEAAKRAGVLVSYDPNLRLPLWPDERSAREGIISALPSADIVKASAEELEFLTGATQIPAGLEKLKALAPGAVAIVITRGARGCTLSTRRFTIEEAGFAVTPVDTTGAGDGFVAGLLAGLLRACPAGGGGATQVTRVESAMNVVHRTDSLRKA